jgi:hypothetical protein
MHPSDVARQLGMPEPGTLADTLDVSVALWNGSTQTLAGLADRTLVPEADVRATLEWAERQNLLHVTGSLDATFTMTL